MKTPPSTFFRGRILSRKPSLSSKLYFGWLSCDFPSIGCRQPPRSVFFHFIFRRSNRPLKRRVIVPPRRSAAAESLSHSSPTTNADWWLVVAFSGQMAGHLRPTPCPSLSFFRPTRCPKTTGHYPPHALRLERISSPPPPHRRSRPSVGCHVILLFGSHLRLMRRPPLYFLMGAFWRPNQGEGEWRERAAPPSACAGLMGRCGAMRRIHGGCCHGERGQSRWGLGGGGRRLILVLCVRVFPKKKVLPARKCYSRMWICTEY